MLNVPPRGIGKTTVDALRETARADNTPLWDAITKFVSGASGGRAVTPLRAFQELIAKLQENYREACNHPNSFAASSTTPATWRC